MNCHDRTPTRPPDHPARVLRRGRDPTRLWPGYVLLILAFSASPLGAASFVPGLVPDWNQPYAYGGGSPNGGPGSDPVPGVVNQWNDWCAPASGANLAGHWADYRGLAVADGVAFPGSSVGWGLGPSWQDHEADGTTNRPAPQAAPGPLPARVTDLGWYMDSNRGVLYDNGLGVMGGLFFNNAPHAGTFLKDVHAGLAAYLLSRPDPAVLLWHVGTRGKAYAGGVSPGGLPATIHTNAAEAFADVRQEIDAGRTLLLSYTHWVILPTQVQLAPAGTNTESANGGAYFIWGTPSSSNAEDEEWNGSSEGEGLGHMVTAVGYIPAGTPDDQWAAAGLAGPTDWVIVHDNWVATPRNVIIPYNYVGSWVANTRVAPVWAPPDLEEAKWRQPPNLADGADVSSSAPFGVNDPFGVVADDYLCDGRPVSAVRWWGSYIGHQANQAGPAPIPANGPDYFRLCWYGDVPAGILAPHSVPARPPLRVELHPAGACGGTWVTNLYRPASGEWEHEFVYRVALSNDWNEKRGTLYWLGVSAVYTNAPASNLWGWATALPASGWNDAAARRDPVDPSGWVPLDYGGLVPGYGSNAVDLAFELLTDVTNTRATKWLQPPDMTWGENMASYTNLDPLMPWVLRADDFRCDGRRITDIHWWGSYIDWASNYPDLSEEPGIHPSAWGTPLGFILSWHADVPADPFAPFSKPGEVLTNLYVPFGHCHEVYYGTVTQEWKGVGIYDHEFQYYVDLLDPGLVGAGPWLEEEGVVYWLNVQAVMTNTWEPGQEHGGWGWKNTPWPDGWNDASVVAGMGYPPGWTPAPFPADNPNKAFTPFCNMAFELTTDEPGTNAWTGDLELISIEAGASTGVRLASLGHAGAGRQYLQCNTNLTVTNGWVAVATNALPLPRPYTNRWTHGGPLAPARFYRIRQQ